MGLAENKEFFTRYIETIFNEGRHDLLPEYVSADAVDHDPLPGTEDMPILEGLGTFLEMRRQAFPTSSTPSRTCWPRATRCSAG